MQRELAELIQLEVKDPRVGMVTITGVEVTSDYAHAKVFFTILGGEGSLTDAQSGLQHAAGFLRSQLGHRMKIRTIPQLHFLHDESIERGIHLDSLIDQAIKEDANHKK